MNDAVSASHQSAFSFSFGNQAVPANENALQDADEVVSEVADGEDCNDAAREKAQTITLDEIMGNQADEATDAKEDQEEEEEDDHNYYEVFVNEIRRKEQLDQIEKETN
mmetsp:Transcript_3232/g.4365  ORF Transcript_3232/g.4365 Transcript_3232/m.4365 type:complete len:109 (+) Transcript_3232:340-666(+)